MAACRMSDIYQEHIPVLLKESVDALLTSTDGIYVDATFGRGGHSSLILNSLGANGRLIAFDKDPAAIEYANKNIKDSRFSIVHASFANLKSVLTDLSLFGQIDGILFDLGVSSPQLDDELRGFSFSKPGKLDMRMDTTQGVDAAAWLATVDEDVLADVLWKFGEERFSRRIARAIVNARQLEPITTTDQLANIIKLAMPKPKKPHDKHPATRSFQAIRIAVNEELTDLEQGLEQALDALAINGRLCAISFHSLEDRLVKQFIRMNEKGEEVPRGLPIKQSDFNARLTSKGKAIKPSEAEVASNPRARSAILRVAEKRQ